MLRENEISVGDRDVVMNNSTTSLEGYEEFETRVENERIQIGVSSW